MDKRFLFSKKMWFLLMVLLVVLMAAAAFALQFSGERSGSATTSERNNPGKLEPSVAGLSKAVLKVDNMSCSGCISTIKGSLSGFESIDDVLVDLSGGRVEVYFRPDSKADVAKMAQAITDSGYPASVVKTFSPEEIKEERQLAAAKSKYYVASVSGYDIARADFDMEMNAARKKYREDYGKDLFTTAQGKNLETRLQGQILTNLIERGTLLREINRSGYRLDDDTLEAELNAYIKKNGDSEKALQQAVQDAGYSYDYFKKRFENGVLISRFIEEKVLAGAATPDEKQRAFADWFYNARAQANVTYYDKDLEKALRQQSGSGSCCPVR